MHKPDVLRKEIGLEQHKGYRGAEAELVWGVPAQENFAGGTACTTTPERAAKSKKTFLQESNMLFQH